MFLQIFYTSLVKQKSPDFLKLRRNQKILQMNFIMHELMPVLPMHYFLLKD
jgi:hypothetical protein